MISVEKGTEETNYKQAFHHDHCKCLNSVFQNWILTIIKRQKFHVHVYTITLIFSVITESMIAMTRLPMHGSLNTFYS